jgi:hypothetical protein
MQHDFDNSEDVAPASPACATEDATKCNVMQHNFEFPTDVAPANPGLRSCPVPPGVLEARKNYQDYLDALDMIKSIEKTLPG